MVTVKIQIQTSLPPGLATKTYILKKKETISYTASQQLLIQQTTN